jgi:hypothetical protein
MLPPKLIMPKKQGKSYDNPLKTKRGHNVLNLSDKGKSLELLKGSFSLPEVVFPQQWSPWNVFLQLTKDLLYMFYLYE